MSVRTAWSNWSGSVTAHPARIERPRTEEELARLVRTARQVRATGAGHSFMPLCETDDTLVSLDQLKGDIDVLDRGTSAWVPAGWSLKKLTHVLWLLGYSLPNQGDVNPQSLAGAMATGTHGTGAELGSLSTFARAFQLVLADGSIVECSREKHPALFEAQRLSLGLLGIATRIQVDIIPAMQLEERIRRVPLAEVAANFEHWASQYRHIEFWVFPYSDDVILKTLHPTTTPGRFREPRASDEDIFRRCCEVSAQVPWLTSPLQQLMMRFIKPTKRGGPAYRIFPSERTVLFEEMEYELPREHAFVALHEVIGWVRKRRLAVTFPFEFRWVAADDIAMSPFHGRASASISMHQYSKMPWRELFADAESILRAANGRPHWAKRHSLTAADVQSLYPRADAFLQVRREFDPLAKFTNSHLRTLFAIG